MRSLVACRGDQSSVQRKLRSRVVLAISCHWVAALARKVSRDADEDVRDHVRSHANTEVFPLSRRERKKVEMAFAHLKRILKIDRLRLRGLSGARDEVLLAATAQNLRKLVKYAGPAPPRMGAACAA